MTTDESDSVDQPDNQVVAVVATLAEKMYLLPRADAFKMECNPELGGLIASTIKADKCAASEVEYLRRAFSNGQIYIINLASAVQKARDEHDGLLIDALAQGAETKPAYSGGPLVEEYSRLLQCLDRLASQQLPVASLRAVRARGEKLMAGSRLLEELTRQRILWAQSLTQPLLEFEGNSLNLPFVEDGVPVTLSARIHRTAGRMFQAGSALIQQADDAERSGGSVTFEPHMGSQFDWFFSEIEKVISGESGLAVEEPICLS